MELVTDAISRLPIDISAPRSEVTTDTGVLIPNGLGGLDLIPDTSLFGSPPEPIQAALAPGESEQQHATNTEQSHKKHSKNHSISSSIPSSEVTENFSESNTNNLSDISSQTDEEVGDRFLKSLPESIEEVVMKNLVGSETSSLPSGSSSVD